MFLCLCSGFLAFFAYRRWAANERAMRMNEELKYTGFLKIISVVMVFMTLVMTSVILL
jgi:putative membrane protein